MKEGWIRIKLKDVCTLQRGFDLPLKNRKVGSIPLMSSSGLIDRISEFKVAAPGVVTGRSGSIGGVHFVDEDFWPLNTTLYVKNFHGNYHRYVYYLLKHFDLGRFSSGMGVPTLNRNHVHDELVCIPESVSEQKRIVAILDEAFAEISTAVANTEKNLANARELFESYLSTVFSQRDKRWKIAKLGDVSGFQGGSQPPKSVFVDTPREGYIRLLQIRDFKSDAKAVYIPESPKNRICNETDIMIGRYGASVGQIHRGKSGAYNVALIRTIPNETSIGKDFFYYYLVSPIFQTSLKSVSDRSAQAGFSKSDIASFTVPLPSLPEQKRIVAILNEISVETSGLEAIYQQKLTALAELKQSLLQKAFFGELTAGEEAPNSTLKEEEIV